MSRCGYCGADIVGEEDLCPYHHSDADVNWAAGNRLMCDFFHRGRVPPRLPESQRLEDNSWLFTEIGFAPRLGASA